MILSILIFLGKFLIVFLSIILTYSIITILFSWIPLHRKFVSEANGVELMVTSNGVHTDFVLPINYIDKKWLKYVNIENFELSKNGQINYLAFGWGDRGFYLDIPTWADLTFKVAFNAVVIPSPTLMHVIAYDRVPEDMKEVEKIKIRRDQFEKLCQYIFSYFSLDAQQKTIQLDGKGYTENDHFYKANGVYHAFNTCNYWVNRGLRKIGVRTSLWSPLDRGVIYQLKKVPNSSPRS